LQTKNRRVAVYLKTHCNTGSKGAFPTGVLDRWHNYLLIYWRTRCHTAKKSEECRYWQAVEHACWL